MVLVDYFCMEMYAQFWRCRLLLVWSLVTTFMLYFCQPKNVLNLGWKKSFFGWFRVGKMWTLRLWVQFNTEFSFIPFLGHYLLVDLLIESQLFYFTLFFLFHALAIVSKGLVLIRETSSLLNVNWILQILRTSQVWSHLCSEFHWCRWQGENLHSIEYAGMIVKFYLWRLHSLFFVTWKEWFQ